MIDIKLKPETFALLQKFAIPFLDTPETVIVRALEALSAKENREADSVERKPSANVVALKQYSSTNLPPMKRAEPVSGSLGGEPIPVRRLDWANILDYMVALSGQHGLTAEELREITKAPFLSGQHAGKGYRWIPSAKVSYQGLNSDRAAYACLEIAKKIGIELEIKFTWDNKPDAYRAGESAMLVS